MAQLFTKDTQAIFWNNNRSAIQRMLDYDYTIKREKPSVAGIVAPTSGNKFDKFFWGGDEIIFKPNSKYLIRFKNEDTNAADVVLRMFWYEPDTK